jgi:hypothetical protein
MVTVPPLDAGASTTVLVPVLVCSAGRVPFPLVARSTDGESVHPSPVKTVSLVVDDGPGCAPPPPRSAAVSDRAVVATAGGVVDLAVSAGRLVDVRTVSDRTLPAPPAGWAFPYGVLSFVIEGVEPGSTVAVDLVTPGRAMGYAKLGPDGWRLLPSVVRGSSVTTLLVDGGLGDADGRADGRIVDPMAPAVAEEPAGAEPRPAEVAVAGARPVVAAAQVAGTTDERGPSVAAHDNGEAAAPGTGAAPAAGDVRSADAGTDQRAGSTGLSSGVVALLAAAVAGAAAAGAGAVRARRHR